MGKLECGINLSSHSVNIFMEAPRSNNAKIEEEPHDCSNRDIWKTSEDEVERLWTHAANNTKEITNTHN